MTVFLLTLYRPTGHCPNASMASPPLNMVHIQNHGPNARNIARMQETWSKCKKTWSTFKNHTLNIVQKASPNAGNVVQMQEAWSNARNMVQLQKAWSKCKKQTPNARNIVTMQDMYLKCI